MGVVFLPTHILWPIANTELRALLFVFRICEMAANGSIEKGPYLMNYWEYLDGQVSEGRP